MAESDYRKAYESAKRELRELIHTQEKLEKQKLVLRRTIESLAAQCGSENLEIEPSQEAAYLLEQSLADEIRAILRAYYPNWLRPNEIKGEMERLGRDLGKYSNPQSAIHMVLKRMVQSKEVQESTVESKQIYRFTPPAYMVESRSGSNIITRATGFKNNPLEGKKINR